MVLVDPIIRILSLLWSVAGEVKEWFDRYAVRCAAGRQELMVEKRLTEILEDAKSRLDQGLLTFGFIHERTPGIDEPTLRRWVDEIGVKPARRQLDNAELWGLPTSESP